MNYFSDSITRTVSHALYKSFAWMSLGLGITASISYYLSQTEFITYFLDSSGYGFLFRLCIILFQIGLGLFIFFGGARDNVSSEILITVFLLFSAVSGCGLVWIYHFYELSSIVSILGLTSIMFLGLATYGFFTKKDLSPAASFFVMLLIGILAFSIINIFFRSIFFSKTLSFLGIICISFFTAYDVQRLKKTLSELAYDKNLQNKLSIIGAYIMYQDFISLFLRLLHLLGKKKKR